MIFNTAQHNPKGIVQHLNRLLTIKGIFAKEKKKTGGGGALTVLYNIQDKKKLLEKCYSKIVLFDRT